MDTIRIALVDDHEVVRESIKLMLSQVEGLEVVYDSPDARQFLEYLRTSAPDVVIMDINMPGMDGIEATARAMEIRPNLRVIALTMLSDPGSYRQVMQAGALGFVNKSAGKAELQQAILEVYAGDCYVSRVFRQKLILQRKLPQEARGMSAREAEVLRLICKGLSSGEISEELSLSVKTVETHRRNIYLKANVHNQASLLQWAIRNNLLILDF